MKKLTIAQAIEILQKYPPDWLFLTTSYEDTREYDTPLIYEETVVERKPKHEWDGEYRQGKPGQKAVIIARTSH